MKSRHDAMTKKLRDKAHGRRAFLGRCLRGMVLVILLACASAAQAARVIDLVTLSGGSSVAVEPGGSVTVAITVTTSGSGTADNWQSTGWRIANGPGGYTCRNHGNYNSSGTYTETFTITAPTTEGIYNAYFVAYSNNSCSSGASTVYTMNNAVDVGTVPVVSSIVRASANPANSNSAASWTVTFSRSVTGVDAGDFQLVQSMGVSGATITSVTGSGTTWTVTANTGNGNYGGDLGLNLIDNDTILGGSRPLGGVGAGNGNLTGQVYMVSPPCVPPENLDASLRATLTCVCDNFDRAALNSPTGPLGTWIATNNNTSRAAPYIPPSEPGYLRLNENTTDNATLAIVPGAYPARGNFISTELRYFAYDGSSADGVALTFATYPATAQGAYGGSLGYAQKTGINGFSNGWVGIGIDEYGNYQNPTEGRQNLATPAGGFYPQSVAVRGSGSNTSGYYLLGGTGTLSTRVDSTGTARAPGHRYQMIVDARNYQDENKEATVTIRRATTGSGYSDLVSLSNVYAIDPNQAAVPDYWQLSLTGSTGTSVNVHEIASLRICAQTRTDPPVVVPSGFNAIDEAYGTSTEDPVLAEFLTGNIYTKLAGTPFSLFVAALTSAPQINTAYWGNVTVRLVEDADGACRTDCSSSSCQNKTNVVAPVTRFFSSTDQGVESYGFTVPQAYRNLIAIISGGGTTACSTDSFSVRPLTLQANATSATNTGTSGAPVFKAGADTFSMTVSTATANYTGTPLVNSNGLVPYAPATQPGSVAGTFNPAVNSIATGSAFTYDDVGAFTLKGYTPAAIDVRARGIHDTSWTEIDSLGANNDCVSSSYSNTLNASGKYGCLFGIAGDWSLGRFVPSHFAVSDIVITNRTDLSCSPPSRFSYMGEPLTSTFTLTAQNAAGGTTKNYFGALAKLTPVAAPPNRLFNLGAADGNVSGTAIPIDGITQSAPAAVTAPAHGLTNGDWVLMTGVAGMTPLNDGFYQVTVTGTGSFTLNNTDTTAYEAYAGGGQAQKRISNGANRTARVTQLGSAISWPGSGSDMGVARNTTVTYRLNRPDPTGTPASVTPDGPLAVEFGIAPVDDDNVTTANNMDVDASGSPDHASVGVTKLAFGRLKLGNAFGSEQLNLPVPLRAEYWNGAMFVTNTLDSCTTILNGNVDLLNYQGTSSAAIPQSKVLVGTAGTSTFNAGVGQLSILKPDLPFAQRGSVDVCIDLGTDTPEACVASTPAPQPWLQGRWTGDLYDDDPRCRVTFGIYKRDFIYLREMY